MGLFDLFKNKTKKSNPVNPEKESSEDFDVLSGEGLIGYIKSNLDNPTDENVLKVLDKLTKPDEDQHHLTKDGELPYGWLSRNTPICEPYEHRMVEIAASLKAMNTDDKIANLRLLIDAYYEYKQFCYSKDECYIKYFSDKWEHCFNSKRKDFEYITLFEEELKTLETNRNDLLQKEQTRAAIEQAILPNLRNELLNIIRSEPGILQVSICKHYPEEAKPYISDELYAMTQEGLIVKEKQGRLNKFYIT